ncbi:MAG TPA: glycosyltransferase family 39 protein, partial [Planctomycetota bacterium]|nr:glycosyltransferase family 39 protein [Planctomycetota bacterium]
AIWGFKARVALRGEIRASLVDPSRPWSHPEYPWLVPLIEAWFELVSGTRTESAGRVAQMGFHAATLLLVFGGLRRSVSLAWSIAGTLALGLLPSFVYWSTFEDADVAIGLAWAGSVIHLHRWLARGARSDALLAALLAVVAAWTKREGVVALALQGACFLAVAVHSRRIGPVLPIAIATLVVLTPWWLVISSCDVVPRDFLPVRIENAHLDRLPWIPILVGRELLSVTHWALLWPLVAVALPLRWKERPLLPRLYLVTSATAPLAILSGTYVFSTWPIWYEHVRNSFERLALQQAPVAVFFVTMTLAAPRSFMGAPGGRDVKKVILLVLGVLCGVYSLAQGAYLVLMLMGRAESNSTRLTASAGILCLALGVTLTLFKAALRAPGPPPGGAVGPSNKA